MADTIKTLSDHAVDATVLIIGVADSVDELIREHQSIERALIQVHMPAMSDSEIRSIVMGGFERLEMEIDFEACEDLVHFSKGVPYITHLLGIYCARAALGERSITVEAEHVEHGMNRALDQWQQSIKTLYNDAVRSEQHSSFYKEVLLACALAEVDEQRYFAVSDVKAPLSMIRGKPTEPLIFVRALRDLSESGPRPRAPADGRRREASLSALQPDSQALHHHARRPREADRQGHAGPYGHAGGRSGKRGVEPQVILQNWRCSADQQLPAWIARPAVRSRTADRKRICRA